MAFTRTASGLSNLARFHGTEMILFTEGGERSFSFEDACNGRFNSASIDIKFWSNVLSKHGYSKSVGYRALGSKTASEKICDLVAAGKVRNILVARDSDLDDFLGEKIDSPYVLYTRGYSWENDVYEKELVKEQVSSLLLEAELKPEYQQLIDECYEDSTHKLQKLVKLELIFRKQGKKFITDFNGERFIDGKTSPSLKMTQIRNVLNEAKKTLERPINLDGINCTFCATTFSYGKLIEALAVSLICYIVGKLERRKSAQKEAITMAMIERYRIVPTSSDDYYSRLVSNLEVA